MIVQVGKNELHKSIVNIQSKVISLQDIPLARHQAGKELVFLRSLPYI